MDVNRTISRKTRGGNTACRASETNVFGDLCSVSTHVPTDSYIDHHPLLGALPLVARIRLPRPVSEPLASATPAVPAPAPARPFQSRIPAQQRPEVSLVLGREALTALATRKPAPRVPTLQKECTRYKVTRKTPNGIGEAPPVLLCKTGLFNYVE